jgi:hypothetical protein
VKEDMEQTPDWLPDGWVMKVKHGEDGALYQVCSTPIMYKKMLRCILVQDLALEHLY